MASDEIAPLENASKDVNASITLTGTRRTSIETALQVYRDAVLQHNLMMLRILVNGMADQEDDSISDEDAEMFRLRPFEEEYLAGDIPESVKVVQDLLSDAVLAELIPIYSLDGVSDGPVDTQKRDKWFREVRASVEMKAPSAIGFPPADLQYLCTLVNGITGNGLPYFRDIEQVELISDPESEVHEVLTHDELNICGFLWEDWEIAIACRLGTGLRTLSGSLTLYCRNPSVGLDWQWRWGMWAEGWCSDMYNTIEECLAWYAHHIEQTAEQVTEDIRPLNFWEASARGITRRS